MKNSVQYKTVGGVQGWWICTNDFETKNSSLQDLQQGVLNVPEILVEQDHIGCFPNEEEAKKFLADLELYKRYCERTKNPKSIMNFAEWHNS